VDVTEYPAGSGKIISTGVLIMARDIKGGLEYYPEEVHLDRKMKLIVAKFSFAGEGCIKALRRTIYAEGYFMNWDEETQLLFAAEHKADVDQVNEIVQFAMSKGLFDRGVYDRYQVLTSAGIQRRYFSAIWKRVETPVYPEIMLIDVEKPEWSKTKVIEASISVQTSVGNSISDVRNGESDVRNEAATLNPISGIGNGISDVGNRKSDVRNPHSRVEESRVEESRVNLKADYMHTTPAAPVRGESPVSPDDDGFDDPPMASPEKPVQIPKRLASINGTMVSVYGRALTLAEIPLVDQLLCQHTAQRICRELTDQKARAPTNPVNYVHSILSKAKPTRKTKLPPVTDFDDEEGDF
jgi:hypothetical protein